MIINFCDKSGKEKEYNCVQFIKRGCQGAVYRLDDGRCLKYFISKYISSSIEEDTFRKISEMELANFYKIYEMLYNKIDLENKFSGYVMEYYKKDKGFERLLKKFTKIIVNDYSSLFFWYNSYIKKNGDNNVKDD